MKILNMLNNRPPILAYVVGIRFLENKGMDGAWQNKVDQGSNEDTVMVENEEALIKQGCLNDGWN
jgi:hypothetical protein